MPYAITGNRLEFTHYMRQYSISSGMDRALLSIHKDAHPDMPLGAIAVFKIVFTTVDLEYRLQQYDSQYVQRFRRRPRALDFPSEYTQYPMVPRECIKSNIKL